MTGRPRASGHEVARLALPALVALVAEPLFLLADAAVVGHLGTVPLAALGVASAALSSAAGVLVFLAYGTTGSVARRLGAGRVREAVASGLDGVWLAVVLGVAVGAGLLVTALPVAGAFGAGGAVTADAVTYLRVSAAGLPGMLVTMAATGVLRGLQDTRTPLLVALVGFTANVALNVVLVYPGGLGIAGSALGTVIAQTGLGVALVVVVLRRAGRVPLRPHPWRVLVAARDGLPLFVRSVLLRAVLLVTTWVAASGDPVTLAAYQVSATVWTFGGFALDALAVAAQALTGRALGAGDVAAARSLTALVLRWGTLAGAALGALVLALHGVLPVLFTADPAVRAALSAALVVLALRLPLMGWVGVLDGVLIGAGDGRWLAGAHAVLLLAYLPVALLVRQGDVSAGGLWWGFAVFMALRALLLGARARGDRWLVTGATHP
ncbi:MATE family efflux transporter [Angustibacter aerolatus]|uniref:MATE family efflux transporter n=1 Tax=Angustibacter aerolatus TaxID=1162965 RepID=A0ABQ6JHV6_9ACTN|nr:MATE family efflux transporter [Angustibacter aerolatus]